MPFRRCALLVLALVVSACVSSSGSSSGERSARVSGGNSRLIVRAQLAQMEGQTAWEAVETLNRRWLRASRGSSISGPINVSIVVDGIVRGDLNELRMMRTENIETMRLLSAADATIKYGTGYLGGVIEVSTRALDR